MDGITLHRPIGACFANQFHSNFDGNGHTISYATGSITGVSLIGGLIGIATPNSNTNGTNYFVDATDSNGGSDGIGVGTCQEHVHSRV